MLYWNNKSAISEIRSILRSGGFVVGSSDTVIGFLVSITKEGFRALNSIKQWQEKPM